MAARQDGDKVVERKVEERGVADRESEDSQFDGLARQRPARAFARQPNPPLRNVKRSELLAQEIVEEILARDLEPGELLPPEAKMLSHYGVGRASLREALRLLEAQGLVTFKPG